MTTRVLQAFDTLDNHSKRTLDRLAKKNHQLTQSFAYIRPVTGLGLHREFSARKKPGVNQEIVSDEQDRLYKLLRKSLAVTASMNANSCCKSVEAGSSRDMEHPEKHTTDVKSSAGHSMCIGKEKVKRSFLVTPVKPQTLRPYGQSSGRMAWSREVEKVPSLHELAKVHRSKALVGISLGDSNMCHWRSRSVHSGLTQNEVDAPFKSPVPAESMNSQQLQENINIISIGSSILQNKSEKDVCIEPVPISFDDLLKRKDVKVLAPRLHKAFLSEQKAGESMCPMVSNTPQCQSEPFSSPGFLSLNPSPQIRKRNLRSAIVLYTEAVQAKKMIRSRSMRERQAGEKLCSRRPYSQPELWVKKTGCNCVNMCVLRADGKVIRSPDLPRPHLHDETPSPCVFAPTKKISLIPRQKVLSSCVGPVINGMNPSPACDSGTSSPVFCKPLAASLRRGLNNSAHMSAWSRPRNKKDFLSISRPVTCSQKGAHSIKREEQDQNIDKEANELYMNAMDDIRDCDLFSVHDTSFSRRNSPADLTPSPQETPLADKISTPSTSENEKTHKHKVSPFQLETVSIPTADNQD